MTSKVFCQVKKPITNQLPLYRSSSDCFFFVCSYIQKLPQNRSTSGQQTANIEQAGCSAIASFMAACRHQSEIKTRKFLAKVIWLLSYDDATLGLADTVDKV